MGMPGLQTVLDNIRPSFEYNVDQYLKEQFNTMVYFEDDGWFLHFANVLDRKERIQGYL